MKLKSLKDFFLRCSLSEEEYGSVHPLVWERNKRTLGITSVLAASMGLMFLLLNLLTGSGVLLPYLFLFCGSFLICLLLRLTAGKKMAEEFVLLLCYAQMLMVCAYAGILSTQSSNYGIPATSIVVFISLLPLSIDDRPLRMYVVMAAESAAYLAASFLLKSHSAFSLDTLNIGTFFIIGMVLYGVICVRNVREISQSVRVEKIQQSVISSLATVVEERDENTGDHIQRTSDYVRLLAGAMKQDGKYARVSAEFLKNVLLAAPMHDLGKIRIPDAILNKPGRLTDEEYAVMKQHAAFGAEIIQKTLRGIEEEDYYTVAHNVARHHHERWDGKGYPDGLAGESIPLEARMMALADVYDALVSERVYKKAFSREKACAILREGAGTQFDPELTRLFLKSLGEAVSVEKPELEFVCDTASGQRGA